MNICFLTNTHLSKNTELTTYDIAYAAHKRKHKVYLMTVKDFSSEGNEIFGRVKSLEGMRFESRKELILKKEKIPFRKIKLEKIDVLFLRHKFKSYQKIPENFHSTAREYAFHLLERGVKVINDPTYLPFLSSKISTLGIDPAILPEYQLVSNYFDEIYEYCKTKLKFVGVMKIINGSGGDDVYFIDKKNLRNNLTSLLRKGSVVVQSYILSEGDKRIVLLNGEPIAWYMRVAQEGEGLHNIHAGAKPVKCELSDRDLSIIDIVRSRLKKYNMTLVGIDTLGGYLSEINSENPGGTVRADFLGGFNSKEKVIEYLEKRL